MVLRRGRSLAVVVLTLFGMGVLPVMAGDAAGRVTGFCDLPPNVREPGWMVAHLIPAAVNTPRYIFVAELQERQGPLEFRFGPISGFLFDPRGPAVTPTHYVDGTWRGIRNAAVGTWEATVYSLRTFEEVGTMSGAFTDPAPYTPGEFGELSGRWRIAD